MAVATRPQRVPNRGLPASSAPHLPPGWPIVLMFAGFPLWWILGLGAFIFPILALPMFASLVMRGRLRAPRGFLLWVFFLAWMLGSAMRLESGSGLAFLYRACLYIGAGITFLYIYNSTEEELPTSRLLWMLGLFWMFVVVGGFLGIFFPGASFPTPFQKVIPGGLLANAWVFQLVHPIFAQVHDFLGYPVGRPTAPFVYTNEWASNMGVLIPLVIASWSYVRRRSWKPVTVAFLILAPIPMIVSLNRGLWLSLSIGLLYAAWRFAMRGRTRALGGILCLFAFVSALVVVTPLRGLFVDRLETGHSNAARVELASEAVHSTLQSPLLGFGSPRPLPDRPNLPSVGTQGQLWMVLFSHGIPGAIAFVGWWIYVLWASRGGGSPARFWAHIAIFIVIVQLPYYGELPSVIYVAMAAAAIALRERRVVLPAPIDPMLVAQAPEAP
jgi:polysaccharide biosynthesis protein PslJ